MLFVCVIILEFVYSAISGVMEFHLSSSPILPPAGLFGLVYLAWSDTPRIPALISAVLLGIIADASGGVSLGLFVTAYMITFLVLSFLRPVIGAFSMFSFLFGSIGALVVVELLSTGAYLLVLPASQISSFTFSVWLGALTLLLSPFFFYAYTFAESYFSKEIEVDNK